MNIRPILTAALISTAAVNPAAASGFFTLAIESGGDTLAELDNGDTLKAGDLLYAALGAEMPLANSSNISLLGSIGWKYGNLTATNGDSSFTRFPLEVMLQARANQFKLAAGLSYHLAPSYSETINSFSGTIDFDNALGFVIQAGLELQSQYTLGVRYTSIDYDASSASVSAGGSSASGAVSGTLNGDSLGLYFSSSF